MKISQTFNNFRLKMHNHRFFPFAKSYKIKNGLEQPRAKLTCEEASHKCKSENAQAC